MNLPSWVSSARLSLAADVEKSKPPDPQFFPQSDLAQ